MVRLAEVEETTRKQPGNNQKKCQGNYPMVEDRRKNDEMNENKKECFIGKVFDKEMMFWRCEKKTSPTFTTIATLKPSFCILISLFVHLVTTLHYT